MCVYLISSTGCGQAISVCAMPITAEPMSSKSLRGTDSCRLSNHMTGSAPNSGVHDVWYVLRFRIVSSLRPELAAIERVLQTVDLAEDLLILSDCQTVLTEIQKWIGEGLRPCMAITKDADILRPVVERLRQRIVAGTTIWLVKIKAHRGEPLNKGADDEAGKGCHLPAEEKQWDELTGRQQKAKIDELLGVKVSDRPSRGKQAGQGSLSSIASDTNGWCGGGGLNRIKMDKPQIEMNCSR